MTNKKFFLSVICSFLIMLLLIGSVTIITDPFFHYHKPLKTLEYPINNQRYQNNGILKHFDYNAIITGTSMTENFKTSEFDELFNAKSVKVSFSGSYLKETNERLIIAFKSNPDIKYVVRSLDLYALVASKDTLSDYDYPSYLYDSNPFNDVKYIFNKSVLFDWSIGVWQYTKNGWKTPDFDDIYNWNNSFEYGKLPVLERYTRPAYQSTTDTLSDEQKQTIYDNIKQNIVDITLAHPDTEFFVFFPPYSIIFWDSINQNGTLQKTIDVYKYVTEILTEYKNIHIFSFDDKFDIICDLNNYKDYEHYNEAINSYTLKCMKNSENSLTKENYVDFFDKITSFYSKYNYNAIFE